MYGYVINTQEKEVKLSLCLISYQPRHQHIWGGGIAPLIHNLGTGWKRLIRFTTRSLYTGERAPSTHWTGG
jgi:hypothetical protein